MAASVSVSSLSSVPGVGFKPDPCTSRARVLVQRPLSSVKYGHGASYGRLSLKRLNAAGLADIEPDINEDPKDRWATNGVDPVSFYVFLVTFFMFLHAFVAEVLTYARVSAELRKLQENNIFEFGLIS